MEASATRKPHHRILLLQGLVALVAAGLSFPAINLHRGGLHERARAEAGARIACPHALDAPDHLEAATGIVDLPCTACLFGLRTLADGLAGTSALPQPTKGGLSSSAVTPSATAFSVRLPASRAPPLL